MSNAFQILTVCAAMVQIPFIANDLNKEVITGAVKLKTEKNRILVYVRDPKACETGTSDCANCLKLVRDIKRNYVSRSLSPMIGRAVNCHFKLVKAPPELKYEPVLVWPDGKYNIGYDGDHRSLVRKHPKVSNIRLK